MRRCSETFQTWLRPAKSHRWHDRVSSWDLQGWNHFKCRPFCCSLNSHSHFLPDNLHPCEWDFHLPSTAPSGHLREGIGWRPQLSQLPRKLAWLSWVTQHCSISMQVFILCFCVCVCCVDWIQLHVAPSSPQSKATRQNCEGSAFGCTQRKFLFVFNAVRCLRPVKCKYEGCTTAIQPCM